MPKDRDRGRSLGRHRRIHRPGWLLEAERWWVRAQTSVFTGVPPGDVYVGTPVLFLDAP